MCGAQARLCCSLSEYGHNMPVCGSGTVLCMCVVICIVLMQCVLLKSVFTVACVIAYDFVVTVHQGSVAPILQEGCS